MIALTGDVPAEQRISDLQRELAHAYEQCRIPHAMAQDWKARALVAEAQVERLQRQLDRRHPHTSRAGEMFREGAR